MREKLRDQLLFTVLVHMFPAFEFFMYKVVTASAARAEGHESIG